MHTNESHSLTQSVIDSRYEEFQREENVNENEEARKDEENEDLHRWSRRGAGRGTFSHGSNSKGLAQTI